MAKKCPYCGKSQEALKNHVRLASGDGHGEAGEYPPEFNSDSTVEQSQSTQESTDSVDGVEQSPTTNSTQESTDSVDGVEQSPTTNSTQESTDGFERVEFPEAPEDEGDDGNPLMGDGEPAVSATNELPDTCPDCGRDIIDADQLIEEIKEIAEDPPNRKAARAVKNFTDKNEGRMVEVACSDPWGCGFYIDGDEEQSQFA
jgi:hypothetical protein